MMLCYDHQLNQWFWWADVKTPVYWILPILLVLSAMYHYLIFIVTLLNIHKVMTILLKCCDYVSWMIIREFCLTFNWYCEKCEARLSRLLCLPFSSAERFCSSDLLWKLRLRPNLLLFFTDLGNITYYSTGW